MPKRIEYYPHARLRMAARGLSEADVEEAVYRGRREVLEDAVPYLLLPRGRVVCVIARELEDRYFVLTAYPNSRRRNRL